MHSRCTAHRQPVHAPADIADPRPRPRDRGAAMPRVRRARSQPEPAAGSTAPGASLRARRALRAGSTGTPAELFRAICEGLRTGREPRAMFAVPGPSGPPLDSPICTVPPREEDARRTCDRRRASIFLGPDPGRTPACGPGVHLAPVARAAHGPPARGRDARRRGARAHAHVGGATLRGPAGTLRRRRSRRRDRRRGRRGRGSGPRRGASPRPCPDPATGGPRDDARRRRNPAGRLHPGPAELQPPAHVRAVRDRRLEPPRPRGGARGRRAPRPRLQPALHLWAARPGQDAPPPLDRELRLRVRPRDDRPLHDGRGVHQPLPRRPPRQGHRPLQGRLPRRRRSARRRRPVPPGQGPHRGGVLPHVQRAARGRRADRPDLRPPPPRSRRARGAAARAVRGRPGDRRPRARPGHAPDDPPQARPAGPDRRDRPAGAAG